MEQPKGVKGMHKSLTTASSSKAEAELAREEVALVLCGGRGTRLSPLTDWRAKPAVPFGGRYRIVDFAMSNCNNSGIRRIGVLTLYKAESLIRHIRQGWGFLDRRVGEFVEFLPAQQRLHPSGYAGTADAVYQNIDFLRREGARFVRRWARHYRQRVSCLTNSADAAGLNRR
jgi:glucose-1-phosphate adenylyltransferase